MVSTGDKNSLKKKKHKEKDKEIKNYKALKIFGTEMKQQKL